MATKVFVFWFWRVFLNSQFRSSFNRTSLNLKYIEKALKITSLSFRGSASVQKLWLFW